MGSKTVCVILLFSAIIVFNSSLYSQSPDKPDSKGDRIFTIGVVPRDNPQIDYEKYQPIVDYLEESLSYKFELVLKRTYDDTVKALGIGDIDIAFLGPLTYLHARADFSLEPMLKTVTYKGEPYYRSVIVTRKDRKINDISDLFGKTFAFASLKSTSGNLIPRYLLADQGIHVKDLNNYRHFAYQDSVVKWVLKGEYDAGSVRESVAEKYLPLGLKIIATSKPIPTGPLVASPKISPAAVEAVRNALLNMKNTESGATALKKVDRELRGGFIAASDSDYEYIRKMINDVPTGCGIGCHPKIKKL